MSDGKYPCLQVMQLSELCPATYNPRKISDVARARLKKSMEELGNIQPIVFNVQTKTVVGGHQRLAVLQDQGDTETAVWCVDLPLEKEKAANLALNNFSGEWDDAGLEALLADLNASEIDMDITGFTPGEIDKILDDGSDLKVVHTLTFTFNEKEWKSVRRLSKEARKSIRDSILKSAKKKSAAGEA